MVTTSFRKNCKKCGCFIAQFRSHRCSIWTNKKRLKLSKTLKGRKKSEEHKRKIGLANKGNKRPDLAEYNRKYKSQWMKEYNFKFKSFQISGSKHPNWQGGKSFEPYGLEFNNKLKEFIRKRDNYRCQECFRHQSELKDKLNIHHIDYNKQNNNTNNLISLCRSCHTQTNYTRKDWVNYFKEKLKIDEKW